MVMMKNVVLTLNGFKRLVCHLWNSHLRFCVLMSEIWRPDSFLIMPTKYVVPVTIIPVLIVTIGEIKYFNQSTLEIIWCYAINES